MSVKYVICAALAVALASPAFAAVEVVAKVLTEKRIAAADGTTRIALSPADRVTPGDTVVYQLAYHNNGTKPVDDLVLSNPVPRDLEYRAPAGGSPAPDLSVDGATFGQLGTLKVKSATGTRAATAGDVRVVRWRLPQPVAPGSRGQVSFQAVLK